MYVLIGDVQFVHDLYCSFIHVTHILEKAEDEEREEGEGEGEAELRGVEGGGEV